MKRKIKRPKTEELPVSPPNDVYLVVTDDSDGTYLLWNLRFDRLHRNGLVWVRCDDYINPGWRIKGYFSFDPRKSLARRQLPEFVTSQIWF